MATEKFAAGQVSGSVAGAPLRSTVRSAAGEVGTGTPAVQVK